MQVTLGGCSFDYPSTPDGLTIGSWIQYMKSDGAALDEWAASVELQPEGILKSLDQQEVYVEKAYSLASYFSGCDAKATFPLSKTLELYQQFFGNVFHPTSAEPTIWLMPPPELQPNDGITFGEFIDSKVIVQAGKTRKLSSWEILMQLAAIWLRKPDEEYDESFLHQGSTRLYEISNVSIGLILEIGRWWDEFNSYAEKTFTVFHPSKVPGGKFSKQHFERWGWVNFLKGIAKTKIFDVPGWNLNSIECARRAPAYDVLVFASEEKDQGEAQYLDMQTK